MIRRSICVVLLPFIMWASDCSAQTATVVTDRSGVFLMGLSDNGSRLGVYRGILNPPSYWSAVTGFVNFPIESDWHMERNTLSGDGHFITGDSRTDGRAYIVSDTGSVVRLPKYVPSANYSVPRGVSYGGLAAFGYDSWDIGRQKVRTYWAWTAAEGYVAVPLDIATLSGNGTFVGSRYVAPNYLAGISRNGLTTYFPSPDGSSSMFYASNYDASVLGGACGDTPALVVESVWQPLPMAPQAINGRVLDVSSDGTAAYVSYWTGSSYVPYLWNLSSGLRPLNDFTRPLGYDLTQYSIEDVCMNDDANIFAISLRAPSPSNAFVLYVTIPAPGAASLMYGTLLFACRRSRRCREF